MKVTLEDDILFYIKDRCMVDFLKDDLDTIIQSENIDWVHCDDRKLNKKLIKAYKRILQYYGEKIE